MGGGVRSPSFMRFTSLPMNTNEVQQVSSGGEFSSTAPFEPLYFMLGIITALLLLNLLKGRYFI